MALNTLLWGKTIQGESFPRRLFFFWAGLEELAENPSQMLPQSARNITIEALFEGREQMGTNAQKHPSAPGRTATSPVQTASQWTSIVHLQQEPAAETCYCVMCMTATLRHKPAWHAALWFPSF